MKAVKFAKELFISINRSIICIINFIAFVICDFSHRIGHEVDVINSASWSLDFFCTISFTIDFLLRSIGMGLFFGKGTFMKSFFGCYYFFILWARS